jgi:hypothetical protein
VFVAIQSWRNFDSWCDSWFWGRKRFFRNFVREWGEFLFLNRFGCASFFLPVSARDFT